MKSFSLNKTWVANNRTTTTFNTPGTYNIPYGRYSTYVSAVGGTTTPGTIASYNAPTPGTAASYNSPTPGTAATYNAPTTNYYSYNSTTFDSPITTITTYGTGPGCPSPTSSYISPAGYSPGYNYTTNYSCVTTPGTAATYNAPTPGTIASYNAPTPGTAATYNAPTPGTVATYNAPTPGTASSALGVTAPAGTSTPATQVVYWSYPDNAPYPVTVGTAGGSVTIVSQ
jgi:hypothetical protein